MKRTKEQYRRAARGLAESLALKLRTTPRVERWLSLLDTMAAAEGGDDALKLERELLDDAWKRLQAGRQKRGVCIDCDHGGGHGEDGHDEECPHYVSVHEAAERR